MTETNPTTGFSLLERQQYANLFTYRKSGEAVKTPIWFALHNGKAYVMTGAEAGKVKRIRNNNQVEIGPADRAGKPLGPTVAATARVLDEAEIAIAKEALDKKYGLFKAVFDFFGTLSGMQRAYLEIAPA
jgi:PPOX class probable F420-dependent enzyme